jgi:hypothetical protein
MVLTDMFSLSTFLMVLVTIVLDILMFSSVMIAVLLAENSAMVELMVADTISFEGVATSAITCS